MTATMTSNVEADLERVAVEAMALADEPRQAEGASAVPTRILIVPWGEVRSTAGTFVVDAEVALATIAAFRAHGTDLPVDYEHQTLGGPYSSPTGLAPAAGWVKALTALSPERAERGTQAGIWAEVEWTADALERLRGRQYRYVSPVALVRREDRRIVGLHSLALTNKPAIVGARPLVNGNTPAGDAADSALLDLRQLLALDESATQDLLVVAAAQRIRSLERAEALRQAGARVERALAAGKLTVAQRDWALALAERDPAEFDRWEADAPQIVPLGRTVTPLRAAQDASASQRAVEQAARAEWRCHRSLLEKLCSEEAYVAAALRE